MDEEESDKSNNIDKIMTKITGIVNNRINQKKIMKEIVVVTNGNSYGNNSDNRLFYSRVGNTSSIKNTDYHKPYKSSINMKS